LDSWSSSAAAGLASSQEEEEDLDQISSREDNSGLKELIATYKPLDLKFNHHIN
jgi:hypothetical protein